MNKILIILSLVFSQSIIVAQDLDSLYREFKIQSKNGASSEAEKTMIQISEIEGQKFLSLADTAYMFYRNENWDEYVRYLIKTINFYSDHPNPGTLEFYNKKDSIYNYSIECLNKVFEIKRDVETLNIRAIIKMELEKYNSAIEDYSLCIKYDSTNYSTYFNRAQAYSKINKNQEALSDYSRSISLKPNYAPAILNRGFLYMDIGNYPNAIRDFENSIDQNHIEFEKAYALNNIGFCYYKMGELESALNYIENSIELYPINSYAYRNLALVYIDLQRSELACESISKSIELGFGNRYGDEIMDLYKIHCNN